VSIMTIKVKDWNKFQHFKDRKPPWIKLYRDILDDLEWHELDPLAAKALVAIWLIASENDGELPEMKKLAFRLRVTEKQAISIVSQLDHWLIQDDINVISDRYQDDSLEIETETYRKEKETETDTRSKKPRVTSSAEFENFWSVYPRKINRAVALKAFEKATRKTEADLIITAVRGYKFADDEQFIPHPATWINQERWVDGTPTSVRPQVTEAEKAVFLEEHQQWLKEFRKQQLAD